MLDSELKPLNLLGVKPTSMEPIPQICLNRIIHIYSVGSSPHMIQAIPTLLIFFGLRRLVRISPMTHAESGLLSQPGP